MSKKNKTKMSQAAPAVPTSSGETGGLVEDSTVGNPQSVSMLIQPAPPNEITAYATQANVIDPILYENFMSVALVQWTTAMLPGTLLWYTPVHPKFANQYIQYITALYNTWAGGMQYKIKVAGTGFHAGALAMVKLPPNVKPSSLGGSQDWEVFGYEIFDPKDISMETRSANDQKPLMYHYTGDFNEDDPNSFGGYICLFVKMGLQTSSTGTNQIGIQIWNRLDMDFMVAQMRPINSVESRPGDAAQLLFPEAKELYEGMLWPAPVNALNVKPSSEVRNTTACYGAVRFDGTELSTYTYAKYDPLRVVGFIGERLVYQTSTTQLDTSATYNLRRPLLVRTSNVANANRRGTVTGSSIGGFVDDVQMDFFTPTARCFIRNVPTLATITAQPDTAVDLPLAGESFILWRVVIRQSEAAASPGYTEATYECFQTESQRAAILGPCRNLIGRNQAYLFQLVDIDTGLPVRYVKFYWSGFMTTNASTGTVITINWSSYKMVPIGPILANDVIPSQQQFAVNALLCSNRDRMEEKRQLKASLAARVQ